MMKILLVTFLLIFSLSGYSQKGFEFRSDLKTLPANHKGDYLEVISVAAMTLLTERNSPAPPKDEFETTADYQKRLEKLKSEAKPTRTKFALVLTEQISQYDADRQVLNVRTVFNKRDGFTTTLLKTDNRTSYYDATNAFGAVFRVSKISTQNYWLDLKSNLADEPINTDIKVDIPTARSLKDNLRTLIYFELNEPYVKRDFVETAPTFSSPTETSSLTIRYFALPLEIWLFNQQTGEIYLKKILPNN
jgi:hypothetical protein